MKLITAIVRTESLGDITKSLLDKGVRGMTITEVKGIGEEMQLEKLYTIHSRIELFIDEAIATLAVNIILEHAHTGKEGDGIIAVTPVERLMRIRTRECVE